MPFLPCRRRRCRLKGAGAAASKRVDDVSVSFLSFPAWRRRWRRLGSVAKPRAAAEPYGADKGLAIGNLAGQGQEKQIGIPPVFVVLVVTELPSVNCLLLDG